MKKFEELINKRLDVLSSKPFRAKFHLRGKELEILQKKGMAIISKHAMDLITKRLAPASPLRDGKQTPYKGHPVFVAQHATATCCRSCLLNWHRIPKGRLLMQQECEYIVEVIETWLLRELQDLFIDFSDVVGEKFK
jgi:hypothetical protein